MIGKDSKLRTLNSELNDFDYVEIIVEDTGIGIKEEDIPKLFESFVRLESPLKIGTLGTGLGLYLTKKLVTEVLKGEVSVKSKYGEGSRFTLIIPINGEKIRR
ncbi:MAG: hypothetical protein FJ241_12610 [Nitrospira sp.]|nr:hypothetical protein [Nitrospira sp.]